MLLSLFTPTHNPKWLPEVYNSILRQDYENWQWVIVCDGYFDVPKHIQADPRVKIVQNNHDLDGVGALKRFACAHCDGSAFIELDHDDLLLPGKTLSVIAAKILDGAGFVYSDAACFKPNLLPHAYAEDKGWESYPIKVYGRNLLASRNFDLTPRSLCEVYYAPDHVRVWSRTAYEKVGGHDTSMTVGDDHDLVCRTYLAGFKFAHTGGCHYLYRLHSSNTFREKGEAVAKQVAINKQKHLNPLIQAWCAFGNRKRLSVGDILQTGWDWERDLSHEIPGGPYSFIDADDVLQLCPAQLVPEFFNRCYDALEPGGYLRVRIPSTEGTAAFLNPLYKSWHNVASFAGYTRRSFVRNSNIRCRFQYVHADSEYPDEFHRSLRMLYSTVYLSALKGQRQPGLQSI